MSRAIKLRDLRARVRQTASLVSTQGPVFERPGQAWSADYETRTIFWRESLGSDGRAITDDELLFVITHEAGHLNYTGGYEWPNSCKDNKRAKERFHRWINGGEDIRLERLTELEFGGFAPLRSKVYKRQLAQHAKDFEGFNTLDQVIFGYMYMEHGLDLPGDISKMARKFVDKTWRVYTRACNAPSTESFARATEALFEALEEAIQKGGSDVDKLEEELDKLMDELEQAMTGAGIGDTPSDRPSRSSGPASGEDNRPSSARGGNDKAALLDGMAKDARGRKKQELESQHYNEVQEKRNGAYTRQQVEGTGDQPGEHTGDPGSWDRSKEKLRTEIAAISRRFQAVLQTNKESIYANGFRRGKLNTRKAHAVERGMTNICRRRTIIGDWNYTVGVMVDVSGSMSRDSKGLLDMTVLLAEGLEKAGIGVFVIPWDTEPKGIKRVDDKLTNSRVRGWLSTFVTPCGGTVESPALVMAQDEFRRADRSSHKILICITDGATGDVQGSSVVIEDLARAGVTLLSIGVCCRAAAHWPHGVSVNSATEAVNPVVELIRHAVRKGS